MSTKRKSALTLTSLWLLMFASSSQFFIIAPLLPQIGRHLNIPGNLQGTLISVYALALGVTALFAGPVSDRLGRRKMLLLGSCTMCLMLMLHILAYDYFSLFVIRLLTGVAGGLLTGTCVSYIRDVYPYEKRGFANGIVATGSAFGQIVAIPIGILVSEKFGFHSPFQLFGIVMLIAFVMIYLFIVQPRLDISDESNRKNSKRLFRSYWEILKSTSNKATAIGYILMFFSITIYIVFFPTWMMEVNHFTSGQVAFLYLVGGIATLAGGPINATINPKLITIATGFLPKKSVILPIKGPPA
ncbi:MAG: MFS transporter, partial [Bacteroidota bacterium]